MCSSVIGGIELGYLLLMVYNLEMKLVNFGSCDNLEGFFVDRQSYYEKKKLLSYSTIVASIQPKAAREKSSSKCTR